MRFSVVKYMGRLGRNTHTMYWNCFNINNEVAEIMEILLNTSPLSQKR